MLVQEGLCVLSMCQSCPSLSEMLLVLVCKKCQLLGELHVEFWLASECWEAALWGLLGGLLDCLSPKKAD